MAEILNQKTPEAQSWLDTINSERKQDNSQLWLQSLAQEPKAVTTEVTTKSPVAQEWLDSVNNKDNFSYLDETGRVMGTAVTDFMNSVGSLPSDVADMAGFEGVPDMWKMDPLTQRPETVGGEIAAGLIQFLVPYTGAIKGVTWATRLVKGGDAALKTWKGKLAADVVAGGVTDFVAIAPEDGNLSTFLQGLPAVQRTPVLNGITEFLATDTTNPNGIDRLKNVLEGAGLGAAAGWIINRIAKGFKAQPHVASEREDLVLENTKMDRIDKAMVAVEDNKRLFPRFVESFEQKVFDAGRGFKHLARVASIVDPKKFGFDKSFVDLYTEYRLGNSIGDFVQNTFEHGPMKISSDGTTVEKLSEDSLKSIFKDTNKIGAGSFETFANILEARRAVAMRKAGKEPGIERSWVKNTLDDFENHPHKDKINAQLERYKDLNAKMLEFAESTGILTAKGRVDLLKRYPYHVPLYRVQEGENFAQKFFKVTKPRRLAANPLRKPSKLKEMTDEEIANIAPVDDIINNIIRSHANMIDFGLKNRLKRDAFNTIKALNEKPKGIGVAKFHRIGDEFATQEGAKKLSVTVVHKEEVQKKLKAAGVEDPDGFDAIDDEFFRFYSRDPDFSAPDVHSYVENGQVHYWKVKDEFFLDSLNSMGAGAVGPMERAITKYGSIPKNFLTRLVTMNPEFFAGSNFIRDTVHFSILSRTNAIPVYHSLLGIVKNITPGGKAYSDHLIQGAGFGRAITGEAVSSGAAMQKKLLKQHGINVDDKNFHLLSTLGSTGKFLNAADDFIARFEHGSRQSESSRLVQAGYAPRNAAYLSRDVTVDFGNRGSFAFLRGMSAIVPFLNASMQGIYRYSKAVNPGTLIKARAAAKRGDSLLEAGLDPGQIEEIKRVQRRLATGIALPSSILFLYGQHMNPDEEARNIYKSINEEVKRMNWVFVTPHLDGTEGYSTWLMPKPYDFGSVGTLMERILEENYTDTDREIVFDYLKHSMRSVFRMQSASDIIPQAVRPFIEVAQDKTFTGAPIVGRKLGQVATHAQFKSNTSPIAVYIAQNMHRYAGIGVSPVQLEHVLSSFFGTIGKLSLDGVYLTPEFGMPGLNELVRSEVPVPQVLPERRAGEETFFRRRFYRDTPIKFTQEGTDFYRRLDEAGGLDAAGKLFLDNATDMSVKEYERMIQDPDTAPYMLSHPYLLDTLNTLANINDAIQAIYADDSITKGSKLNDINDLLEAKNEVLRTIDGVFMETFHSIKEGLQ